MTNETASIPSIPTGILQPAFQHRFRISFPSFLSTNGEDDYDIISLQTVSCKFNFKNKTAEVVIECPATISILQTLVQELVKNPDKMIVSLLDGAATAHQTLTFHLNECLEHSLDFDYAEANAARHHLVFSYCDFKTEDFKL